jgi:hypothetical protein
MSWLVPLGDGELVKDSMAATPEDRTLTARRRLIEGYGNAPIALQPSSLELPITSPLEGAPRLGTRSSAGGARRT